MTDAPGDDMVNVMSWLSAELAGVVVSFPDFVFICGFLPELQPGGM